LNSLFFRIYDLPKKLFVITAVPHSFLFLFRFLLLPEGACYESGQLFILYFLVWNYTVSSKYLISAYKSSWFWLNDYCSFKLSNKFSCLISQNWVVHQKVMLQTFLDTDFSSNRVFETSYSEGKSWVFLINNWEERPRMLAFQTILLIELPLKYSASSLGFPSHAITWGGVYIKMDNISSFECPVVHSLVWSLLINDNFISVI